MESAGYISFARCCSRPDLNVFGGNQVCLSCGASDIVLEDDDHQPENLDQNDQHRLSGSNKQQKKTIPYEYQLLTSQRETRLIKISSGQLGDPIRCRIIHTTLESAPTYDAISYTWADAQGDSTLTREVVVSADPQHEVIQITANCEDALRRIRHPWQERILFVDALCINQADVKERGHQVRLMPEIYRHARSVIIYVGETNDESDLVMDMVQRFGVVPSPPTLGLDPKYVTDRIQSFLSRSWFHRVWVLQEVGMAQRALVVCGSKSVPWECFIIFGLDRPGNNPLDYTGPCPPILSLSLNGQQPLQNIYRLLSDARTCSSTDPRDKVYAVYGLLENSSSAGLFADYAKSIESVYTEIAEFLITRYNSLDVLGLVEPRSSDSCFPSWVPDWRFTLPQAPVFSSLAWNETSTCADAAYVTRELSTSVLRTKGHVLGTVSAISETFEITIDMNSPSYIESRWAVITQNKSAYGLKLTSFTPNVENWVATLEPNKPKWVNTLKSKHQSFKFSNFEANLFQIWAEDGSHVITTDDTNQKRPTAPSQNEFNTGSAEPDGSSSLDITKIMRVTITEWLKSHRNIIEGRRFFVTSQGHFGVGPATLQLGDTLCKLKNTSVSHLLRKRPDQDYTYVGECLGGIRREDLGVLLVQFPHFEGLPSTAGVAEEDIAIW